MNQSISCRAIRFIRRSIAGSASFAVVALIAAPVLAGNIAVKDAVARVDNDQTNGHRIEIYMEIANGGPTDRLYAIRSDLADEAMLSVGNAMQGHGEMQPGEGKHHQMAALEIRTGEIASLQKGGAHIMLNNPSRLPGDGTTFPVTLFFENAGKLTVTVTMKSADLAGQPIQ